VLLKCLSAVPLWLCLAVAPCDLALPRMPFSPACLAVTGQPLTLVALTRADPDLTSQLDLITVDSPDDVGAWLKLATTVGLPCLPCSGTVGQGSGW